MRFAHALAREASQLRIARIALEEWCLADGMDPESILIVGNELCTNAIQHGAGALTLRATGSPTQVRISVEQAGAAPRVPRASNRSGTLDANGRGLRMVQALASSWGWISSPSSLLVWATIERRIS